MNVSDERLQILEFVKRICFNIITNPGDEKYRSIHLKAIKKKFTKNVSYNLLVNLMLNAGFYQTQNGSRLIFNKYKLNDLIWFTDNDTKLHMLLNMGFQEDMSWMALRRCHGNVDNAIQHILAQNIQQQNNCSINYCQSSHRLHIILTKFSKMSNNKANSFFIVSILNDFHHILFSHHSDADFKYIYDKFDCCNMLKCEFRRRNYRVRDNECKLETDTHTTLFQQIIDKIHCYVMHSYDLGHRLTPSINSHQSRRICKLSRKCTNTPDCNKYNQLTRYNFGQPFYYWKHYETNTYPDLMNKGYTYSDWYIQPKYKSLKEEITNNCICTLNVSTWQNEYDKVCLHIQTDFCKKNYIAKPSSDYRRPVHNTKYYGIRDGTPITNQHLTSVMIYCCYTNLSYKFSETFRKISSNKSKKKYSNILKSSVAIITQWENLAKDQLSIESDTSLKERHSNFHHMAKYLIEATNLFSSTAVDGNIKVFYHGINQEMMFDSIGQYMYQPLSTTCQYAVASQFSNNAGLILEIKCAEVGRYFNCWWISDYSSESELLFIHCTKRLLFTGVTNAMNGKNYDYFFRALAVINKVILGDQLYDLAANENVDIDIRVKKMTITLIKCQLEKKYCWMDEYMENTLKNICLKTDYTTMSWDKLTSNKCQYHSFLKRYFCRKECEMIDLDTLFTLFPNLQMFSLKHVKEINCFTMKHILQFLSTQKATSIKLFLIGGDLTKGKLNIDNDYERRFGRINWMFVPFRNNIVLIRITADLSSREGILVSGFCAELQKLIGDFNANVDVTPIINLCLKYYYNLVHMIDFAWKLFNHKLTSVESMLLNMLLDYCKRNPNAIYKVLQIIKNYNNKDEETNESGLIMKAISELCSIDEHIFGGDFSIIPMLCESFVMRSNE